MMMMMMMMQACNACNVANVMATKPPMKTPKGGCTCPDLTCLVGDPYKPLIATVAGSYRASPQKK